MIEEIEIDLASAGGIYRSNYLHDEGFSRWSIFLREAAKIGTDDSLAEALRREACFKLEVERKKPKGGYTIVSVPVTAAQTLAEAQFNMYYMRALARRAIDGNKNLLVYRAKEVEIPREQSERMIGTHIDPTLVLRVLRETKGVEPSTNIPLPNSGLTVCLI